MKTFLQSLLIVLFLSKPPDFLVNAQDVVEGAEAKKVRELNRQWNEKNFREVAKEVTDVQAGGAQATIGVFKIAFGKRDSIGNRGLLFLGNVSFTLQELSIRSQEIDPGAFKLLRHYKKLSTLKVETPVVDDRIFEEIAHVERLDHLSLAATSVTGARLSSIANLRLRRLNLSDTKLNRAGMNALGLFPGLEELDIGNTEVDDDALEVIASLKQLNELSLYRTKIKNIEKLTGPTNGLPDLKMLNIARTQVDDTLIDHLKSFPELYYLNIRSTNVTTKGLAKLVDYKDDLTSLGSLQVTSDQMDDTTAKKLKDAYPNLGIYIEKN